MRDKRKTSAPSRTKRSESGIRGFTAGKAMQRYHRTKGIWEPRLSDERREQLVGSDEDYISEYIRGYETPTEYLKPPVLKEYPNRGRGRPRNEERKQRRPESIFPQED